MYNFLNLHTIPLIKVMHRALVIGKQPVENAANAKN